jgi:hypothetical protein
VLALLYLLGAPPIFLLGPLAGLLILSRPSTLRESLWLGASTAWVAIWLWQPGGVALQALRALGVLATGAFVALALADRGTLFRRALLATTVAFVALGIWCVAFGLGWGRIEEAIGRELGQALSDVARQAQVVAGAETAAPFWQAAEAARGWAALAPGVVFVQSLVGLTLGYVLHHALARRPIGATPGRFASFRFSDQLVWLLVVGLALALLAGESVARDVGANLVLIAVALYAARGMAIVRSGTRRVGAPATTAAALAAFVFLPFVVGGLTLLGLADTWLDFRRRMATPATGG